MKALYSVMGLITAFCVTFVILITSVEAVVYYNPDYFLKEYVKYRVLEQVHMEMDDLLTVTEEMMDYLKGDREDLVVQTIVDGEKREFFNEKEKHHMADVQGLFLGAIALRRSACVLGGLFGAILLLKKQGQTLLRMLQWGMGLFIGGMAALGLLISTNFTKYFTCFHLIFFDNNDWLLDPETDLLINIVPEGFFRDTVCAIAFLFLGGCLLLFLGVALLRKWAKK